VATQNLKTLACFPPRPSLKSPLLSLFSPSPLGQQTVPLPATPCHTTKEETIGPAPRAPALRNTGTNTCATRASTRNKNAETVRASSSSPPPAANGKGKRAAVATKADSSDEKVKKAPARPVLGKTKPVSELSPTETRFFNYAGTCVPNFLFYIAWERAVLTVCFATDPHENSINGNTFQAWMDDLGRGLHVFHLVQVQRADAAEHQQGRVCPDDELAWVR
jgi:hypothetical protein